MDMILGALFAFGISLWIAYGSEVMDELLSDGVKNKVYTGVVAIVGTESSEYLYSKAFGYFDYIDDIPDTTPVTINNLFDLASLSKVVATTSAVALLYQRGYLSLDAKIVDLLGDPLYAQNGKSDIKVLNCLLHNAGYKADPNPVYWKQAFGCPNSFTDYPAEDFSCMDIIYTSLLNESTTQPPGEAYVYSDLSFITLQLVVGRTVYENKLLSSSDLRTECTQALNETHSTPAAIFSCYFEAFVRTNVFQESDGWLPNTAYVLSSTLYSSCLPTLNDTGDGSYTHQRFQGQVSDRDCYAMGGVCGHAGVFSSAPDLSKLLRRLLVLAACEEGEELDPEIVGKNWLNATTVKLFTTEYNQTQSSRAFGWTINDPTVSYKLF